MLDAGVVVVVDFAGSGVVTFAGVVEVVVVEGVVVVVVVDFEVEAAEEEGEL